MQSDCMLDRGSVFSNSPLFPHKTLLFTVCQLHQCLPALLLLKKALRISFYHRQKKHCICLYPSIQAAEAGQPGYILRPQFLGNKKDTCKSSYNGLCGVTAQNAILSHKYLHVFGAKTFKPGSKTGRQTNRKTANG